jgi:capsular exopolysaccharide synthesis family protein
LATLESEIDTIKKFNRADPALKALKKETEIIRKTLKIHSEQQFRDADLRRKIHAEQERMLKQAIDKAAEDDLRKSQKATEYNLLERQFQAAKEAHKSISRRLEDAIVNAENDQKTVVLVDSALIPSRPISFARSTTLWNGALLGIFLGLGLSVVLNLLDNRLRTTADVESSLHLPVLGVVPAFSTAKVENMTKTIATLGAPSGGNTTHMVSAGSSMSQIESALESGDIGSLEGIAEDMTESQESPKHRGDTVTVSPNPAETELFMAPSMDSGETEIIDKNIVLVSAPLSSESEAFRTVLTTLAYGGNGGEQKTPHTILISSGQQGDGKSTIATNLAVALGEVSGETLLIDADLRLPTVHKHFGQPRVTAGLADYLSGERDYHEVILHRAVGGLSVMFAGNPTVSPSLLFRSNAMSNLIELLKDEYDHIIIDGPPLIQVADALLLSKLVDGVALVVRSGKTPRPVAQSALQQLKQVKANVVGTILNGVEVPRRSRNDEYYYYMSQVE